MPERLKVLISAYTCKPGEGSEAGIGWNWVKHIAPFHDVWVVTRTNNREAIERELQQQPIPGIDWVYYDLPLWMRFWKRGGRGWRLYYFLWQIGVYFHARQLHRREHFDLTHLVTFGTYWLPCFLGLLPIPFIWGPVGGGEFAPSSFYATIGIRDKIYERLRDFGRWSSRWNPILRLTARSSNIALATTPESAEVLRRLGCRYVEILSHAALPSDDLAQLTRIPYRDDLPFRLVTIGRLIPLKGVHLSLAAFARLQQIYPSSEYWIIGDGAERDRLENMAHQYGIGEKVKFLGFMPRPQVLEHLTECDILIQSSFHESSGWVAIEAMAAGKPVICLDLGGPALQVTDETGIKIPTIMPDQVVKDLADAMLHLGENVEQRRSMSEAGRERVKSHYTWESKGKSVVEFYKQVLQTIAD
jgi:glycosyltransferase involved in cell wall biosynthesis